jgi:hypothetical protein
LVKAGEAAALAALPAIESWFSGTPLDAHTVQERFA